MTWRQIDFSDEKFLVRCDMNRSSAVSSGDGTPPDQQRAATAPLLVSFAAGGVGAWRVERITPVIGESLAEADRLNVTEGHTSLDRQPATWTLRGSISNTRYTTRNEVEQLVARQEGLGRPSATRAALIPIRKTEAWWMMAQDERKAIFEEQSRHIAIGLRYLPGIARRLHHARELGETFDFLTWFEYAPEDSAAFEELVQSLRATPEWRFVEREVDIRLSLLPT
jgi:Chlorite dismutase